MKIDIDTKLIRENLAPDVPARDLILKMTYAYDEAIKFGADLIAENAGLKNRIDTITQAMKEQIEKDAIISKNIFNEFRLFEGERDGKKLLAQAIRSKGGENAK